MSGTRVKTAEFILYDVGFAGSPEEAQWLIREKEVFIDGERITDPQHQRVYFNGKKFPVTVDGELLYFRSY